jgi:hypothetical protein
MVKILNCYACRQCPFLGIVSDTAFVFGALFGLIVSNLTRGLDHSASWPVKVDACPIRPHFGVRVKIDRFLQQKKWRAR